MVFYIVAHLIYFLINLKLNCFSIWHCYHLLRSLNGSNRRRIRLITLFFLHSMRTDYKANLKRKLFHTKWKNCNALLDNILRIKAVCFIHCFNDRSFIMPIWNKIKINWEEQQRYNKLRINFDSQKYFWIFETCWLYSYPQLILELEEYLLKVCQQFKQHVLNINRISSLL